MTRVLLHLQASLIVSASSTTESRLLPSGGNKVDENLKDLESQAGKPEAGRELFSDRLVQWRRKQAWLWWVQWMILFYDEDYYEDDDYDDANHDEDEDDDDCDDDDCDDDLLAGSTRQVPWAQQFCNRGLKPLRAHH